VHVCIEVLALKCVRVCVFFVADSVVRGASTEFCACLRVLVCICVCNLCMCLSVFVSVSVSVSVTVSVSVSVCVCACACVCVVCVCVYVRAYVRAAEGVSPADMVGFVCV